MCLWEEKKLSALGSVRLRIAVVFSVLLSLGGSWPLAGIFLSLKEHCHTAQDPQKQNKARKKFFKTKNCSWETRLLVFLSFSQRDTAGLEFIFCAKTKLYSACVTRSANQITATVEKGGLYPLLTRLTKWPRQSVAVMSQVTSFVGAGAVWSSTAQRKCMRGKKNAAGGPRLNDACQVILRHVLRSFHLPSEKAERKGITGYGHVQISPSSP